MPGAFKHKVNKRYFIFVTISSFENFLSNLSGQFLFTLSQLVFFKSKPQALKERCPVKPLNWFVASVGCIRNKISRSRRALCLSTKLSGRINESTCEFVSQKSSSSSLTIVCVFKRVRVFRCLWFAECLKSADTKKDQVV